MSGDNQAGRDRDALSARVRALERAVTDSTDPPAPLPELADATRTLDALAERVADLETRTDDLRARQQAVEAYVDRIDHVNDGIERRADAALAAVDRLERTDRTTRTSPGTEAIDATDADPGASTSVVTDAAATTPCAGDDGRASTGSERRGASNDDASGGLLARVFDR